MDQYKGRFDTHLLKQLKSYLSISIMGTYDITARGLVKGKRKLCGGKVAFHQLAAPGLDSVSFGNITGEKCMCR